MTKIVTLYNHKGGVSKTTTCFNLAHFLAVNGHRVLAVDADPQCNLTELMLAPRLAALDEKERVSGEEQKVEGTSLLDVLKPRINGDVPQVDLDAVEVINISDCLQLLRGDVSLSDIEDSLAEAHIQRFSNKVHEKRTYVALYDFLKRYGDKHDIDYILIDVGPSSGALTRSCFLACDGYFIPTAPDRFNVQAIGTLSVIISRWIREHQQVYNDFIQIDMNVAKGKPKCLGVILQNFKIRGGKPKPSYSMWMKRIPSKVESSLFPKLREFNEENLDLTSALSGDKIIAAHIRDFESLAPLMQEVGKPIFDLSQDDTRVMDGDSGRPWSGSVWDSASERMKDYHARISQIAGNLELL
ncbi:ParA family protein [Serratia nevei]|uniref:ParA family protein n=1 Tax=Serratia TaxID=613 RepID=UPI0027E54422|nr:ParA family protein [Serratia nevei]MDQ7768755.1 ParA family protein [Serratia nevei]HEJ9150597.1 ParA family protein [Serratia marcescens]